MTNQITLDDLKADIQAIDSMLEKYQIDPSTAYDHNPLNVRFFQDFQLENLMDDFEELGHKAEEFSSGFYRLLAAAREDCERKMCERRNRVFSGYTLLIEGEAEPYELWTTANTTTEVLLKLGNSISGKKVLDVTRYEKSDISESDRRDSMKSVFGDDDNYGCKVCNEFDTFLWACAGACEVAILACEKHNMYTVVQHGRYKGDDINLELLWLTWDDLTEIMTDQDRHDEQ